MASLLDGFLGTSMDDPRTMGLLALAGGLVRGDFGGGLQSAGQAISAAQDAQLKRQLIAEDLAMKKLAEQRAQQQLEMQRDALTRWRALQGGGQPSQPEIAPSAGGALGSGTFGIPTGGQQAITPRNNIDAQLSALGEMAMAGVPGAKEQLDILKYRNDPQKVDAGGYTRNPVTGEMTYNVDPTKNIDYNPATKTVTPLNGAVQTQAALSLASEIPKAFVNAASTINLRRGPDNREYPVPAINENPYLGALLQSLGGNAPPQGASAPQTLPAPPLVGVRPATAPQTAPRGMNSTGVLPGEADRAAILNAELQKSQQRLAELQSRQAAGDKAVTPGMIASEQGNISDLTKQLGPNAKPAGGPPNPATGYGMSTEEANNAEADKARKVKQAEADVMPTQQRKAAIANADYLSSVLDMALNHPGLSTATGMQGTIDPRNYLPGTNATNFRTLLDQIKGNAFMQAYTNLRGGGQITEVEGKKATDAIARLNTAQSTPEFIKALQDFKGIVDLGRQRLMDNSTPVNQPLPAPTKGMVRNGYRYVGGDPSSSNSWEKL